MRTAVLAATILASTLVVPSSAVSQQRFVDYVPAPSAAAGAMWSDLYAVIPPGTNPDVFWRTARDADGRRITATFFGAPVTCGPGTCPTRIFVDEDMVYDGMLCSVKGEHRLDVGAHVLQACDETVRIDVPPASEDPS